jgi:tagatose 1,6-diphosphate aldolase GatY/KbaY
MRDVGHDSLYAAARDGRAIGAFSTYTMEQTQAICLAADEAGQPVIIQAGASAFAHSRLDELGPQALLAADLARVHVGVHLDHSRDLSQVRAALEAGYTSVMVDGSHLPFEDNVAMTCAAVAAAKAHGAWVEGELGAVPGHEDRSMVTATGVASDLTDPALAEEFVSRTGVHALAVAVGNVHGTAEAARPLELDLLKRLHAAVDCPLVLHGASGLPTHELHAARSLGVAKVNVNTELRAAFLGALEHTLPSSLPSVDLAAVLDAARDAVRAVVLEKILELSGPLDTALPGSSPSLSH